MRIDWILYRNQSYPYPDTAPAIPFYVCFADLNNLKPVNDNLDHDAGDRYLVAVDLALQEAAGTRDIVSRYGRDEFLLIISQDGIERVRADMDNAQWSLKELSDSSEYPFELWVSYGIFLFYVPG